MQKGRSFNTARAYSADMKIFAAFVDSSGVESLQKAAELWLTSSRSQCQSRTVLRRAASLALFSKMNNLSIDLVDYKLPSAPPPVPHPLPNLLEDALKMIAAARSHHHKGLVAFGAFAGLRVSESISIKPSWIDLKSGKMTIHGKGDKYRIVPISNRLNPYILPLYIGAKMDDRRLIPIEDRPARAVVTSLAKRAGVAGNISSHDLRATFATVLYAKTKDINMVRSVLGHSSTNTTLAYLGISGNDTRRAMEFDD